MNTKLKPFDEYLYCGQPLPFFLYVASKLQRILLIWWEKPAPLEEFLLPPPDGLDWRVPSYILDHPEYQEQLHTDRAHIYGSIPVHAILNYIEPTEEDPHPHQTQQLSKVRESNHTFLTMLFQSHGHGSYEYNNLRYQVSAACVIRWAFVLDLLFVQVSHTLF